MTPIPPFNDLAMRQELLERINQITGVDVPVSRLDGWPKIPLPPLTDAAVMRQFLDMLDWYVEQVRAS